MAYYSWTMTRYKEAAARIGLEPLFTDLPRSSGSKNNYRCLSCGATRQYRAISLDEAYRIGYNTCPCHRRRQILIDIDRLLSETHLIRLSQDEVPNKIRSVTYECTLCGNRGSVSLERLEDYYGRGAGVCDCQRRLVPSLHREVLAFCLTLDPTTRSEEPISSIYNKPFDIYVPKFNLLIECQHPTTHGYRDGTWPKQLHPGLLTEESRSTRQAVDKLKAEQAIQSGYNFLAIWPTDDYQSMILKNLLSKVDDSK